MIKSFLDEDITHVFNDKAFLTECLLSMDACSVVKKIFFDPNFPQNNNIRIQRGNEDVIVEVHTKSKWKQVEMNKLIADLVYRVHHVLNWHKIKNNKDIGKDADNHFRDYEMSLKWLDDMYENNDQISDTKNEIYEFLQSVALRNINKTNK